MAGAQEDFLYEDDFDAILAIIDADFLENDVELNAEIEEAVKNIPSVKDSTRYPCDFCDKVCLSKGGLTRHLNTKHSNENSVQKSSPAAKKPEEILHPLYFKRYLEKSATKLAADECYPVEIMDEFKNFNINSLDDVSTSYSLIKHLLTAFNGNAEVFYPQFYKVFSETNPFKNYNRNCSLLLGFEVGNHALSHLTGATFTADVITFAHTSNKFSEKERSIIGYLSGYVFGTFYRRIRFSKSSQSAGLYHEQCLSFLVAGKCSGESIQLPEHKHVDLHDRGGLWKVTEETICIFSTAESYFISSTKQQPNKIDCPNIVTALMKDCYVLMGGSRFLSTRS